MRKNLLIGGAAAVLLVGVVGTAKATDDYTVQVVLPSATNLVPGSPVKIDGFDAGKVKNLDVRDGKAVVTVEVSEDFAPLHDGAAARISWKALLGERILDITPGETEGAELPDGAIIEGATDRVELDQVLAALDQPTRQQLNGLIARLDASFSGSESDLQQTLAAAGPSLEALGQVLSAVGDDGAAIRKLVTRTADMAEIVATRDEEVRGAIDGFNTGVGAVSTRQSELSDALSELPSTLRQARKTLDSVPETVEMATPLLEDLQPAAARLPGVADQLAPVLADLRPVANQLRPTLEALAPLLRVTPGLLDSTHSVLPQAENTLAALAPALDFLRPYTPELVGWLGNWGAAAGNYDSNGHYLRAFIQFGATSLNINPGVMPPGVTNQHQRLPGDNEKQPWTDANGSELR
ncbi:MULTISPECIES: MlaD family protein [unclassified Nocardioides]|uniref:MlaD family protein n=1 Tax=unclassified Nocardioides TaxID=2615069 RepID=UPI000A57BDA3|nr:MULTISPECIES: MlaD family protein [unclassified Nocardioides]